MRRGCRVVGVRGPIADLDAFVVGRPCAQVPARLSRREVSGPASWAIDIWAAAGSLARYAMWPRKSQRDTELWADRVARVGYVAKGLVFLLVGGLAIAAAAGLGGRATDPSGALVTVTHVPAGRAALALVALGLFAHAAFRATLVVVGEPYVKRGPISRVVRRAANGFGALVYVGMAITAGALAGGWGAHVHTNKDAETRHLSARILTAPFGRLVLVGVALGILVAAVVQLVRAFGPNHVREQLRVGEMTAGQRRLVVVVARIAFAARGVVLGAGGYFMARAAIDGAPREARGPAGSLHALGELPHGNLWLATVGAGLIAFGAYGFLQARWRQLFAR
jgi:hypothetical protein